jgi:hypothetical protein
VLAALAVAGFLAFGWAWHGAKHAVYVPLQAPWVFSGGLGGLALVGLAVVSWQIFLTRRADADHNVRWEAFTREVIEGLAEREASD